jgi:predicted lipid carrier protein YhbT
MGEKMDEKILGRIRRKLTLDADYMDDCAMYDAMDAFEWELPSGLASSEFVRKQVSTDAHDALKTAINLFDTHNPKWEILPRGPADTDAAEELERWLEWHMTIANQQGDEEPSRQMLKHAAKYGRIATQIDFLPYWCKEGTEEYKDALAKPFCITVHHPSAIRYERGKYGLRWVASVSNIPAADVIDHWDAYQTDPVYGKGIKSALAKVEKLLEDDDEARLMYVDYTDKEKRLVFAYLYSGEDVDTDLEIPDEDFVEILDGENKLGFINWAISAVSSEPLLYSLHKGNLWENQNLLDTIAGSTVLRRAFFPLIKHTSVSGKPLDIDFSGAEAVVEQSASDGEQTEVLFPPPLDPAVREWMDRNTQKGASSVGMKGLMNTDVTGNVQFAAVQAQIDLSKSVLDPYLTAYQHNGTELAKLAFMWIVKSGMTITGYRTKDKNPDRGKVKGEKINIGPEDFDPRAMIIKCELLASGDELRRMNVFSQAKQIGLHVPDSEILERMNWGTPEALEQKWMKEQIQNMALTMFQKQQDAQLQMMVSQQQMQMQMQAQQAQQQAQMQAQQQAQQPPQGMSPPEQMGGAQMMPGGMANDPNQGGLPPAMSNPQETRTQTQRPQ